MLHPLRVDITPVNTDRLQRTSDLLVQHAKINVRLRFLAIVERDEHLLNRMDQGLMVEADKVGVQHRAFYTYVLARGSILPGVARHYTINEGQHDFRQFLPVIQSVYPV